MRLTFKPLTIRGGNMDIITVLSKVLRMSTQHDIRDNP